MKTNRKNIYSDILKFILDRKTKELIGVMTAGSVGRGNDDDSSDYDFVLIYYDTFKPIFPEGRNIILGRKCGIRNIPLSFLKDKPLTPFIKHACLTSKVEYDPKSEIKNLVKKRCIWKEEERAREFINNLVKLSNIYPVIGNYKFCWSGTSELEKAIKRKRYFYAKYLVIELLKNAINLRLIADYEFMPSEKVIFSPWLDKLSKKSFEIYKLFEKDDDILQIFYRKNVQSRIKDFVSNSVTDFEKETILPVDLYSEFIKNTRVYK